MRTGNRLSTNRHSTSERGQAIVLLVLVFVGLLGIMGLAIDGGRLYTQRRAVQNAADNAALAAAFAMCNSGNASTAGTASAAQNGFTASPPTVTVSVQTPPTSGTYSGDDEYVVVTITSRISMGLGRIVFSGTPEVSARATARCTSGGGPIGGGNGLIALNPSQDRTIEMAPSGCIKVNDGGIFVNSTNSSSVYIHSYGPPHCTEPRLQGQWLQMRGGYSVPSWLSPSTVLGPFPPQGVTPAMVDPLATLPVPSAPALAAAPSMPGCNAAFITGVYTGGNLNLGNHWCTGSNPVTLQPGRYNTMNISSDARAILSPGLYYIAAGGGFNVSGAAQVTGNGVMLFVADGPVNIGASGNVTLTAQTSGPYAGMAIFMGRETSSELRVSGAGVTLIRGTVYAANSRVVMEGSGTNKTLNAQMIAWRYYVSGAGTITINYDPSVVFGSGGSSLVELSE